MPIGEILGGLNNGVSLIKNTYEVIKGRFQGKSPVEKRLFSWNEIPGNDEKGLKQFIENNYSIDWVNIAKSKKIDNDRTIEISTENNHLLLKLNDKKTKVNLEIDDGRTDEFIVKTENKKLNVYVEENLTVTLKPLNPIAPIQYEFLINRKIPTVEIYVENPWQKDIEDFQVQALFRGVSELEPSPNVNLKYGQTVIPMFIPLSSEKLFDHKNLNLDVHCTYKDPNNKQHKLLRSKSIKILSKNDMVWAIEGTENLSLFIAAWVTPSDPEIKNLIKNANNNQEAMPIGGLIGYDDNAKKSETYEEKIPIAARTKEHRKIHLKRDASLSCVLKEVRGGKGDIEFYFFNSSNLILFKEGKSFERYEHKMVSLISTFHRKILKLKTTQY